MEEESLSISINYKFSSYLGERDAGHCLTYYTAEIHSDPYGDNALNELLGKVKFKIINLDKAENEGLDIYEMFDETEYVFRHGSSIFNFRTNELRKPLLNEFPDLEYTNNKICLIETIGIIPKYRGRGFGAKIFKDIIWNFDYCNLFMLQPYPLQFEHSTNITEFKTLLELEKFEKNKRKANSSLRAYYQSWGLKPVKGIKDLLFYCPLYRNEAFENIDMDY